MTFQNLTPEQIGRLRQYGAETPGRSPVVDHAPPARALAPLRRPTYDAAELAGILDGLNAAKRQMVAVTAAAAARTARVKAQATADAAARTAGRLTSGQRAEVLRHSHAVADSAAAPNALTRINQRNAEAWKRRA